jgi:F-type H+-transporting ATPase subunit alpha
LAYADREHGELMQQINQTGAYDKEIEGKFQSILETFKATQSW